MRDGREEHQELPESNGPKIRKLSGITVESAASHSIKILPHGLAVVVYYRVRISAHIARRRKEVVFIRIANNTDIILQKYSEYTF